MHEYECSLIPRNRPPKVFWDNSSKAKKDKDKITIEHILPQALSEDWEKYFGNYDEQDIKLLSASLGNLLLLEQSINASLQNKSFHEKKKGGSKTDRRGYEVGSYSELKISQKNEWTASEIKERGQELLSFMECRWKIKFTEQQKDELLHIPLENSTASDTNT